MFLKSSYEVQRKVLHCCHVGDSATLLPAYPKMGKDVGCVELRLQFMICLLQYAQPCGNFIKCKRVM